MNIDYTLWPNTDGNLGNIKVQIPDGVNTFWPEGDALVHNFVYKDGKLAGFVDTKALTVNDSKSTVINYDYFDIELPFTEGEIAITRGERSKYFNVRYNPINDDNVVITLKYKGCKTVNDVKAVDPNYKTNDIVDGVWSEGLGDLESGSMMFVMCSNLTSFTSDLSSLTDGPNMFYGCSSLTTFDSDLSSLTNGNSMFYNCKLDTDSIIHIADTIKDVNGLTNGNTLSDVYKSIDIGIANRKPNVKETKAFDEMVTKGWTIYVNGSEYIPSMGYSITTLDENGEEVSTPVPYYAKPLQTDEEHAEYIDSEGNFFTILGGQFIYGDDLSTYGMFTCEEDAAANMRLTKIVKEEL